MLIVSWNVAGLSTTVQRIHKDYGGGSSSSKGAASSPSPLVAYLERHQADILCLQEHKIPKKQLSSRSEPKQCSTIPRYESFWSCCVDPQSKGMNGVVTYARKGTVCRADSAPLGIPELDEQGRCVMTDHGTFVLFNVYVPASGGNPLTMKMRFLFALRRAMERQSKPAILVGDLNIAQSALDIYWKDRMVYVSDILVQVRNDPNKNLLPQWKLDLLQHYDTIVAAMHTQEVVPTKTSNSHTGEQYDKFRLTVQHNNKRIHLGKHESVPDYCSYCYDFIKEYSYVDPDTEEEIVYQQPHVVRLQILAECMIKIAQVQWDDETLRQIANNDASIGRASPTRQWLTDLLSTDYVDVLRHYYPKAQARFTCWHQFTNRRYVNDGSRIDYTIVDRRLLPFVRQGTTQLRCGISQREDSLDPQSENAALLAATANGRFEPVSYHGGGIADASREALDTQFGEPHTGMIYTPPSYSDHIAVCLLLNDTVLPERNLRLDEQDAATKRSQPHKQQMSIASFFRANSDGGSSSAGGKADRVGKRLNVAASRISSAQLSAGNVKKPRRSGSVSNTCAATKSRKGNILHHFQPQKKKPGH